ncbi:hypothetical protein B5M42_010000 [Paenibacillus athensensis]|uniref:Uncharacterized protein n=1 Tax=Paenibacillus athensensis TaxID=1967502 RepID=A0A4Y8Q3Q7_9BACL|nr:hypothetical protein [Paenibacillus athensensis]MCD1259170.1 hypothetical protein [Paenibacillus athensensis]
MSHISEIFDRAHIQCIREFLLRGVKNTDINSMDYKERLADAHKAAIELIEEKFPDMTEFEEVTTRIYDYAGACEDVYMEIGLQCGFMLAMQMFHNVQTK